MTGGEAVAQQQKMCLDCRRLYTDDSEPCPGYGQGQPGDSDHPFEGVMVLRMPPGAPALAALAEFATEAGQPVHTVTRAVIHLAPDEVAWAELDMYAGADGRPVLDVPRDPGRPGVLDFAGLLEPDPAGAEQIRVRTFRWLIGFAQERPAATGSSGRSASTGSSAGGGGGSLTPGVVATADGNGMPGNRGGGGAGSRDAGL